MEDSWDVQRDHIKLMRNLKRILRPNGTIVFSNNKRGFKMDFEALDELGLSAVEISAKTLPLDFERNKQIHNCWIDDNESLIEKPDNDLSGFFVIQLLFVSQFQNHHEEGFQLRLHH